MATLLQPLRIYPYQPSSSWSLWYLQQRNIFNFNTTSGSPLYIHMKTSISGTSADSMWMFEAVGYDYGRASAVRCAWGLYCYNSTLYQTGVANIYSGMDANGSYMSSDNYICLRAYASSHYFNGFTLNAYASRLDSPHSNVSILAASQNDNSGNYY
jgi:hypothetical protein